MATKEYQVKAPDGSMLRFRAPEDAPREKILAFAKKQFESRAAQPPESQLAVQPEAPTDEVRSSPRMARAQRARSERQEGVEQYLSELEKRNPYLADELRNMNPLVRAGLGAGAGFEDLLIGAGIRGERTPSELQALEDIRSTGDAFGVGRTLGQSGPFAGAGLAAGAITKTAPLAVRGLAQGVVGATEGGLIAEGTGGDALTGTVIGGTIGGVAEVIGPYLNRAARSLVQRVKGAPPAGRLIDDAGRPTAELRNALEESGESFDDLIRESSRKAQEEGVKSTVEAGRAEAFERAAGDVNVDQDVLGAAERLGLGEDVPVAVVSKDQATQELAGALAAVQGTRASDALDNFTETMGRRADDLIEEMGGSVDRGFIDESLKTNIESDINRIRALEDRLYKPIDDAIGLGTRVEELAAPLKNRLMAKARNSGGKSRLPRHERDMLQLINSREGMTYQNLIDKINEIGSAAYRKTDAYGDIETYLLKELDSDLRRVRDAAAEQYGVGNKMRRAKQLGQQRFALQESSDALFGKNLDRSIFPRIDRSVKGLEKGSVREFRATMESIPERHRKAVAATMLNTAMTGGRNQSLGVNSTQFAKWFGNLKRNDSAMRALNQYIGDDAMQRMSDLAEVSRGVSGVLKGRVRTGITPEALKALDNPNRVASKLYAAARAIEGATGSSFAAAPVANVASLVNFEKTPAVEAADQLLSSTKFRRAVMEAAKSGDETRKFKRLEAQLKSTPAYKKYIGTLDQSTKSQIAATGLIAWLAAEEEQK